MATKKRKKSSGKIGNQKLIGAIITILLAIFGFAYNGINTNANKNKTKVSHSKKTVTKKKSVSKTSSKRNSENIADEKPTILKGYQVLKVSDGDTMNIQKVENGKFVGEVIKIRMYGIDAPEKKQDYGIESKQALEKLVIGKNLEVEEKNKDRYGRTVAVIYADGKNVNEEMVKNGNAWWYQEYSKNYTKMKEYQENAQKNKLGLFSKKGYVEPWNYRREKRETGKTKK